MRKNIKTKNDIIVLVLIYILVIILAIFTTPIGNMEEIWKYNICQAIVNGKQLYKDINLVNTPLVYLIGALFVKIKPCLISFRIITVIMWAAMLLMFHIIAAKLNQSNLKIFAINLFFIFFCSIQNGIYLCYNQAVLLATLGIIYIILRDEISNLNLFEIGLLNALAILCKYSTGIVVCLGTIIVIFIKIRNKGTSIKHTLIHIATYLAGLMLPNALFLGYLMASGSFADFFDMTFAGTTEFKNNALSMREIMDNAYIIVFLAILLVIPVAILFDTIKHKNYNKDKICVAILAISNFAAAYPIFDPVHFYQGFYILALLLPISKGNRKIKPEIVTVCVCSIVLIYMSCSAMSSAKLRKVNGYGYVFTTDYTYNKFHKIDKFVSDNNGNVKIIDPYAAFYDVELGRYIKYEGCFLNGNIGEKTPIEAFESIVGEEDVVLMYDKKDITNRQFPIEICDYIESHYKRDGKIEGFNVYKKR